MLIDYIIVGSGPAGAVLAKTLSDDHKTSVLLIEAGDNNDRDKPIRDSTFAPELEENFFAKYFWQGEGIPQNKLNDRTFEWTTGRLSGGGSSINGEQYVRPTPQVMKQWEKHLGPIWSPIRAIRRFKKMEKFMGRTNNPKVHGNVGRIHIRQAPVHPTNMANKLVKAIEQATGFKAILDYNDPNTPLGPFTRWQLFQKTNGQRESSSTAFLSSDVVNRKGFGVKGRKLRVLYKSTALRVLISKKRAIGLEFLRQDELIHVFARKKVILSAGINSAQLLMLSGIGPANILKKAGIPVNVHNPNVGRNLRNHTLNTAVFKANPNDLPRPRKDQNAIYSGGAFLPDPTLSLSKKLRGVQLVGIGSKGKLTIAILYLRPKSKGTIKIQNNDPLKMALADEAFLANRADMDAVKKIYKTYIKAIAIKLASIDSSYKLISPTIDTINNDSKLEEFIRDNFDHNHHQQSALRMSATKRTGVVDHLGNVHGVQNLIVADDSIIPFTVDGNTTAPAYLIGFTIAQNLVKNRRKYTK